MGILKEFEGTTISVRPKDNPRAEIWVVDSVTEDPPITVLRKFGDAKRRLDIPGEMLLTGGEVNGHIIERISPEELELRNSSVRKDPLTTSNRVYWGW